MVDLEADDAPGAVASDPAPSAPDTPVSESTHSSTSDAPSKLEDLYDFDDPTRTAPETPSAPAAAGTATPVAPAAAPDAPTISPALQQRAAQMGYTPEVIATIKDPVALEAVVRTAENAAMQAMQFARQQMQPQPAAAQPQQQTLQIPAAPAAPTFDPNAMRADLIAKNFDGSLVEAMVGLASQNHQTALANHQVAMQQRDILVQRLTEQDKYNQASQQFMQGYQQQFQQLQAQHQKELLDRDYATFSAGLAEPVQKLVSDPANRQNIFTMAFHLANGMAAAGGQMPPNPEIFKTAMYAALGDKIHQAATETVRQEVRQHQARATTRPSGSSNGAGVRNGAGGADAAGRFADEFFAKHGFPSQGGASFEV